MLRPERDGGAPCCLTAVLLPAGGLPLLLEPIGLRGTRTHARVSEPAESGRAEAVQRRDVEARAAPWKRGPHFSALWISARRAGGRAERQTARGRQRTAAFWAPRRRREAEAGGLSPWAPGCPAARSRPGSACTGSGGAARAHGRQKQRRRQIRQQPNRAQQERRRRRRARTCSTICRALPSAWSVGSEKGMLFDLPGTRGPIILGRAARAAARATPPATAASNSTTSTCRARAWGARLRRRAGQAPINDTSVRSLCRCLIPRPTFVLSELQICAYCDETALLRLSQNGPRRHKCLEQAECSV